MRTINGPHLSLFFNWKFSFSKILFEIKETLKGCKCASGRMCEFVTLSFLIHVHVMLTILWAEAIWLPNRTPRRQREDVCPDKLRIVWFVGMHLYLLAWFDQLDFLIMSKQTLLLRLNIFGNLLYWVL